MWLQQLLRDFEAFGLHTPQHGVLLDYVHGPFRVEGPVHDKIWHGVQRSAILTGAGVHHPKRFLGINTALGHHDQRLTGNY